MKRQRIIIALLTVVLMVVGNSAAATVQVGNFGDHGWKSDDTRNSSGTDLVGTTFTHYGKPGQTPTTADDDAIAQQLQFVAGPTGGTFSGALKIIAPTGNPAKSTLSNVNLSGFAPAADLVGGSFTAAYKWYMEPNPTTRTLAFRIGIQSTAWAASQAGFTATRSGESTWDLILVHVMASPTANAWNDVAVDMNTGLWYLYGQAGNSNWSGIAGSAPPAGTVQKSLADWQADATWGPYLFGVGAKITNVQFGLGSYQQQCNVYVDYLQTTILNGGSVIDFVKTEPVYNVTKGTYHPTIQAGIDAASSGDELHVAAGTFVENNFGWTGLRVQDKSLKIIGAGSASTIVKVANKTNGIEFQGNLSIWLEGMTFTKDGATGPGFFIRLGEVASTYSAITFKDLVVEYAAARNVMFDQRGIYTSGLIENCVFRYSGRWGFSVNYPTTPASGLTFKNSSFLNNGTPDGDMNSIGLDLQKANNVVVENCLFDGNLAKGISLGAVNNLTFTNVTVSNNGHPSTAIQNRNGVSFWEFVGTSSNISFVNPTIINNGRGIMLGTEAAGNTITGFTVTGGYFAGNSAQNLLMWQSVPAGLISGVKVSKSYLGSPYIYSNSPAAIDFSANWWESADAATVRSRANGALNDYTPWLKVGTDMSSDPGFQPDLSYLYVDDDSPQVGSKGRIQEAVEMVSGSTVELLAGTYVEPSQVVIDKSLTMIGASKSNTFIKPGYHTGTNGDARGFILVQSGCTFNLSKVTIDGAGWNIVQGLRSHGTGTIDDVNFTEIKAPSYGGLACVAFNNMTYSNCTFTQIGRVGIIFFGTDVTAGVASHNTYTGKGVGDWIDYGVEFGGGAVGTVDHCTITQCRGVASSDGSTSAGILATTYYGAGTKATITHSTLTNNTEGIAVGYDASDVSTVIVHSNNISNNTEYGISSTKPLVDAKNNWWGDPTGPEDKKSLPNTPNYNNPSGLGNKVSANVDYDPWFTGNVIWDPDPEKITTLGSGGKKTLAVKYLGGGSLPLHGYKLIFTWDKDLVDASIPIAGDVFPAGSMFEKNKGDGSYTINAAALGSYPGNPGPATLFTVDFTGSAAGVSDLVFATLDFRANLGDGNQAPVTGIYGDDGKIIIDVADPSVTNVLITNLTLDYTDDYIKNTDAAKVTATITDDNGLTIDDITADLTPLGGGAAVKPDSYDPITGLATWMTALTSVTCNPSDGTLTITVTVTDMAGRTANGSDTIIADNTLPAKVTNFKANITATSGHRKVNLSWTNGTEANPRGTIIRYKGWGSYPFYNTAEPAYPASITDGDGSVSTDPISGTSHVHTFAADARDIYYYTAFACDMAGNISTVASGDMEPRDRSTNYFLGDLGSGTGAPPGSGGYDGNVGFDDLNMFAMYYWDSGASLPAAIANIGPTVANKSRGAGNSFAIPNPNTTPAGVEFEDMMIFTMNYGVVAPKLNLEGGKIADYFALELKGQVVEEKDGPELVVRVHLANDGRDVKGASVKLNFNPECLNLLAIEKGRLFGMGETTTFFKSRSGQNWLQFDASVLGAGVSVSHSGDLAILRFAVAPGKDGQIAFDSFLLRDAENQPLNPQTKDMSLSEALLPTTFDMSQNYPNPFNPETTIQYQVPEACYVELVVYNANGQQVTTLVRELKEPGRYKVVWNGRDQHDMPISSGLYYYRIKAGDYNKLLKMVFLK